MRLLYTSLKYVHVHTKKKLKIIKIKFEKKRQWFVYSGRISHVSHSNILGKI